MKRSLNIMIVLIIVIYVFSISGCGKTQESTNITIDATELSGCMSGMTLKVATTGTYAPFTYFDETTGDVIGFDLDLIYELQNLLGFTIENDAIITMNAATITASLAEGKIDIGLAALCATDERREVMNFSDTYYDAGQIILVNTETSPTEIQSLDDLIDGKYIIAVESGSAAHLFVKNNNIDDACIMPFNEGPIAFSALEDGKVDCFIQDAPGIPYYLRNTPNSKITVVGEQFNMGQSPYAIALSFDVCTRYTNLQEIINLALKELTRNGTLDKIDQKWCR